MNTQFYHFLPPTFFSEQFKDLLVIKTKLIILWFMETPKIAQNAGICNTNP